MDHSEKNTVMLVNGMMAKPGENNLIFISTRFDPGHWEIGINYIHFLVAVYS